MLPSHIPIWNQKHDFIYLFCFICKYYEIYNCKFITFAVEKYLFIYRLIVSRDFSFEMDLDIYYKINITKDVE